MALLHRFWSDQSGAVVSAELILVLTVLVLGLVVGMSALRDSVVSELSDVAGAWQNLNQGVTVWGVQGHSASTAGWSFTDNLDFCDSTDNAAIGAIDNCITISAATVVANEGATILAPTGN